MQYGSLALYGVPLYHDHRALPSDTVPPTAAVSCICWWGGHIRTAQCSSAVSHARHVTCRTVHRQVDRPLPTPTDTNPRCRPHLYLAGLSKLQALTQRCTACLQSLDHWPESLYADTQSPKYNQAASQHFNTYHELVQHLFPSHCPQTLRQLRQQLPSGFSAPNSTPLSGKHDRPQ